MCDPQPIPAAPADAHADAAAYTDPHPTPTPTPTADPDADHGTNYNTAEYRASTYAVAANAIAAYNAGATGKGVKIGIVDSGINPEPRRVRRPDRSCQRRRRRQSRGVSDEGGHGTAVSAVAAAARNGSNTMGVAFDATIISVRADDPGLLRRQHRRLRTSSTTRSPPASTLRALAGAKVINLSLGGSTPGTDLARRRCSAR